MGMSRVLRYEKTVLASLTLLALVASGVHPFDRPTWFLETAPVMLGLPLLMATRRCFPLTPLVYRLLFIHGLILMLGGAYTYSRVPLGFWVQDAFELTRNHYDRLGHLAQGFIPAMLTREILVRATPLRSGGWLFFLTTCVVLAFSASYEFIEWWTALLMGGEADATCGIRSGTCFWRCWAPWPRNRCCRASTTVSWKGSLADQPLDKHHPGQHQRAGHHAGEAIDQQRGDCPQHAADAGQSRREPGDSLDRMMGGGQAVNEDAAADQEHGGGADDRKAFHQKRRS
ncbi:MAG: hypothetical protein H6R21_3260, partial [Proteobacteria bacterium]|nr:hypothetical protein [Pseudomonadota bacterium]